MKIFAIVVTYNGEQWIEKCLSSLEKSSISVTIIVVDNASTDNTIQKIRTYFPNVILISSEENMGFGQANNMGIKTALAENADYLLLINQDAYIDGQLIEGLIQVADDYVEYGILSPFHLSYTGVETEKYFGQWVLKHYTPGLIDDIDKKQIKEIYESEFVHAACWLMPISTIKKVGGFDPLFFHYGEDNDYVHRLHYKGLKMGIVPHTLLYHDAQNTQVGNRMKDSLQMRNDLILALKNLNGTLAGVSLKFLKGLLIQLFSPRGYLSSYLSIMRILPRVLYSRVKQKKDFAYLKL